MFAVLLMVYDHEPNIVAAFNDLRKAEKLVEDIGEGHACVDLIDDYEFYTDIQFVDILDDPTYLDGD